MESFANAIKQLDKINRVLKQKYEQLLNCSEEEKSIELRKIELLEQSKIFFEEQRFNVGLDSYLNRLAIKWNVKPEQLNFDLNFMHVNGKFSDKFKLIDYHTYTNQHLNNEKTITLVVNFKKPGHKLHKQAVLPIKATTENFYNVFTIEDEDCGKALQERLVLKRSLFSRESYLECEDYTNLVLNFSIKELLELKQSEFNECYSAIMKAMEKDNEYSIDIDN